MRVKTLRIKKMRKHRCKNHWFNKQWVFQYSLRIADFKEAEEIIQIPGLNMTAWQVNGAQNKDHISFLFRSREILKTVKEKLPEKFHTFLHEDF